MSGGDPRRAYRVLGLPPDSSAEEVKRAWRDLAQVWHPDRFPEDSRLREKADENLKKINAAYETLRDYQPTSPPTRLSRISASFREILGLGELGEPPPGSASATTERGGPPIGTLTPTEPIGLRRSLRVLGLGVRPSGALEAPSGHRHRWLIPLVVLLALAVIAVALAG